MPAPSTIVAALPLLLPMMLWRLARSDESGKGVQKWIKLIGGVDERSEKCSSFVQGCKPCATRCVGSEKKIQC